MPAAGLLISVAIIDAALVLHTNIIGCLSGCCRSNRPRLQGLSLLSLSEYMWHLIHPHLICSWIEVLCRVKLILGTPWNCLRLNISSVHHLQLIEILNSRSLVCRHHVRYLTWSYWTSICIRWRERCLHRRHIASRILSVQYQALVVRNFTIRADLGGHWRITLACLSLEWGARSIRLMGQKLLSLR